MQGDGLPWNARNHLQRLGFTLVQIRLPVPAIGHAFAVAMQREQRRQLVEVTLDRALAGRVAGRGKGDLQLRRTHARVAAGQQLEQLPLAGDGVAGGVTGQETHP
ncbi:hypothetical protein D3C79_927440 [compost metagenome]